MTVNAHKRQMLFCMKICFDHFLCVVYVGDTKFIQKLQEKWLEMWS